VDVAGLFDELGIFGSAAAAPIASGDPISVAMDVAMTPASVMKIQVALATADAIATGRVDGSEQRVLAPDSRTPGPVGISLMTDEVRMSVRDLLVLMLTISDNEATDELIATVGIDAINALTAGLGLTQMHVASDLRTMLDAMARETGFADCWALTSYDPELAGAPDEDEVERGLAECAALDPRRGTRTTAAETVRLLQAIWAGTAAHPDACATVRRGMARQLTRNRIASGFGPEVRVAAKSGGLMGLVRNEAGVVTYPDGQAYAVAVFTRRPPGRSVAPAAGDAVIGRAARALVDQLRA
jgi:beta-lactamase class A